VLASLASLAADLRFCGVVFDVGGLDMRLRSLCSRGAKSWVIPGFRLAS
jgi:hypothetical protein